MGGSKLFQLSQKSRRQGSKESLEIIEADEITVEIVDNRTGRKFRRKLPVRYCETANGVILEGETSMGNPSRISFFSEAALAKLGDLFGKGPDTPRCGGHEDD